jgi:hypothetical protein
MYLGVEQQMLQENLHSPEKKTRLVGSKAADYKMCARATQESSDTGCGSRSHNNQKFTKNQYKNCKVQCFKVQTSKLKDTFLKKYGRTEIDFGSLRLLPDHQPSSTHHRAHSHSVSRDGVARIASTWPRPPLPRVPSPPHGVAPSSPLAASIPQPGENKQLLRALTLIYYDSKLMPADPVVSWQFA